jgi:hypothetical protein
MAKILVIWNARDGLKGVDKLAIFVKVTLISKGS